MAKKSKAFIYVEYASFRVLFAVFRLLPIDTALFLARLTGLVVYLIDRRHRHVALENLRMAFDGELSERELRRVARGVYKHLVMVGAEILKMGYLLKPENWRKYVTVEYEERAAEIFESGRGAIFITGHIGNWELNAYLMYIMGRPLHSIARELDNPLLERYVRSFRARLGQDVMGKRGALRRLVRYLKNNEFLGMVVDQDGGKDGVFVDFFGRKASWVPSPAAIALKMDVPIVPAYSYRLGNRFKYKIYVDRPIEPVDTGNRNKDIRRVIKQYSKQMEQFIRAHPEQWLWNHRRWKTRPPAEITS